jgi:hypothetical protein
VLLHHVQVVEQPLAGGADVDLVVGGRRQAVVGVLDDPAGLVQPDEQAGAATGGLGDDALRARQGSGAIAEVLGAEQLAADRAGEKLVGRRGGPGKQTRQARRGQADPDRSGLAGDNRPAQRVSDELMADTRRRNVARLVRAAPGLGRVRRVTANAGRTP